MSNDHGGKYLGSSKEIAIGWPAKQDDVISRSVSPSSNFASSYPNRTSDYMRNYGFNRGFGEATSAGRESMGERELLRARTTSCVDSREEYASRSARRIVGFSTVAECNGSERGSTESDTRSISKFGAVGNITAYQKQSDEGSEELDSTTEAENLSEGLNGLSLYAQGPPMPVGHYQGHRAYTDLIIGFDNRWAFGNPFPPTDTAVDSKAIEHRRSALYAEPRCTWSGQLPCRPYKNPTYSPKVFLGGVPWDITTEGLTEAFQQFGQIRVVYANDKMGERRSQHVGGQSPKQGYLYVVFESDKRIKELLQACTHDYSNGGKYYFNISSRRMRSKEVQVIPWVISDSNFVRCPSQRLDPSKTVFVGALHGMLTAEGLAHVCNDLFGGVAYVGIDTDKFKYPIGSGRVTFNNQKSYMKAVAAAFVDIKATRFTKKIQIDPYLENSLCSSCNMQPGPIFCRDTACFRYFCRSCWRWTHSTDDLQNHKPIMRNRRD